MEVLYTIESDAGPYQAPDPDSPGHLAGWLFHNPSLAEKTVQDSADGAGWRVVPVSDLDAWLNSLLEHDITHVVECLLPSHSTARTTAGWLLMLRAQQAGRELPTRPKS